MIGHRSMCSDAMSADRTARDGREKPPTQSVSPATASAAPPGRRNRSPSRCGYFVQTAARGIVLQQTADMIRQPHQAGAIVQETHHASAAQSPGFFTSLATRRTWPVAASTMESAESVPAQMTPDSISVIAHCWPGARLCASSADDRSTCARRRAGSSSNSVFTEPAHKRPARSS